MATTTGDTAPAEDPFLAQQLELERQEDEREFATQLCVEARAFWKKPVAEPLDVDDFYYEMHHVSKSHSHDPSDVSYGWSMSAQHLVAVTMQTTWNETGAAAYAPVAVTQSAVGDAVIYTDAQVTNCVLELAQMCARYGHEVRVKTNSASELVIN